MKLTDLEPQFLKREVREEQYTRVVNGIEELVTGPREYHVFVDTLHGADGVMFLCPKCFNDDPVGPVGTHRVICWRPRVPPGVNPKPGRWEMYGDGYEDLSLVAGSSSVLLQGGCNAHFFVTHGEIRMC